MHTARCLFAKTVEIADLFNPRRDAECSSTDKTDKENKLKDMNWVLFLEFKPDLSIRCHCMCIPLKATCVDKLAKRCSCMRVKLFQPSVRKHRI